MNKKQILRAGAIVAVAGATGFVMQSQDRGSTAPRVASVVTTPPAVQAEAPLPAVQPEGPGAGPRVLAAATAKVPDLPILSGVQRAAAPVAEFTATAPTAESDAAAPMPQPLAARKADCAEDLVLVPSAGALLELGLIAPCRAGQRVLLRHAGLVVTGRLSPAGTLAMTLPALTSPAEVTVAFADGSDVMQDADVPDLDRFDRFAVQWMADDAFALHAFADGAGYDQPGHIHADAAPGPLADGGMVLALGDGTVDRPLLAQVFTWPADRPALSGKVGLVIEAPVTEATCGREMLGETLQRIGGRLTVRDLTLAMPACDAAGGYVVLTDPVADDRLAARN
jgi:hypothetical protein